MQITNPYAELSGQWVKGALHLHSTNSDGANRPAEVWADYARLGFDFAALTDHNKIPSPADLASAGRLIAIAGCEYRVRGIESETNVIGLEGELPFDVSVEASFRSAARLGQFLIYNHPNWHFDHWPAKEMLRYRAAHAMEIYNAVCEHLQGPAEATDKWDRLLTCGYRIWGVATDDAHTPEQRNQAWVMVDAPRERQAILAALRAGRFYASTGLHVEEVRLTDGVLCVRAPGAAAIRFIVERGTTRKMVESDTADYAIREDDVYVRVECLGAGLRRAWLNPLFVETERSRALSSEFAAWYAKGPMT